MYEKIFNSIHTWCSASFIFVCSKACAASCWNPSPVRVEKLSTVPLSHMSWITWLLACCFKKSKLLPYSCSTSYTCLRLLAWRNFNEDAQQDWQCTTSGRPKEPFEAIQVDFRSCSGDQRVSDSGNRHEYSALRPSFSEENPRCMVECTNRRVGLIQKL